MKGRTPTAKEKEWMNKAREVGCVVCIKEHLITAYSVPTEYTAIHHIEGRTKPDAHFLTIPLCAPHHQHSTDALHFNKTNFERKFGTQRELLTQTKWLVKNKELLA